MNRARLMVDFGRGFVACGELNWAGLASTGAGFGLTVRQYAIVNGRWKNAGAWHVVEAENAEEARAAIRWLQETGFDEQVSEDGRIISRILASGGAK